MNAMLPKPTVVDQIFGQNKAPIVEVLNVDFAELKREIDELTDSLRAMVGKPPQDDAAFAELGAKIVAARSLAKRADSIRVDEKAPILDAGRALDAWFKDALLALNKVQDYLQGVADAYTREKAAVARAKAQREAEEARARADAERAKAEAAKSDTAAANAEARAENFDAKADAAEASAAASTAELTRVRGEGVTASGKEVWTAAITDYVAAISPLGSLGPYFKRETLEAALTSMVRVQKGGAVWPGVLFKADVKTSFRA